MGFWACSAEQQSEAGDVRFGSKADIASPIPRLLTTPIFRARLQQGFAIGGTGFNDKFALQKS
jgi:hypothetical protein